MLPGLQGCVKDDLSGCPVTGTLDLTLSYTYHNKGEADLEAELYRYSRIFYSKKEK